MTYEVGQEVWVRVKVTSAPEDSFSNRYPIGIAIPQAAPSAKDVRTEADFKDPLDEAIVEAGVRWHGDWDHLTTVTPLLLPSTTPFKPSSMPRSRSDSALTVTQHRTDVPRPTTCPHSGQPPPRPRKQTEQRAQMTPCRTCVAARRRPLRLPGQRALHRTLPRESTDWTTRTGTHRQHPCRAMVKETARMSAAA